MFMERLSQMVGIYLGAYKALHKKYNIKYQDINSQRDIPGDMLEIDLSEYDYIIATPPCNYYSRANYRRETSEYSQKTKHLLPGILEKLINLNKPFIIENVRNKKMFQKIGLLDKNCQIIFIGRHTYWTNINFKYQDIKQKPKVEVRNGKKYYQSSQNLPNTKRQGTQEVHEVIERFLEEIHKRKIKWLRVRKPKKEKAK